MGNIRAGPEAYANAGVAHSVLALTSGDISALSRLVGCIADEVIPDFK